MKTDYNELLQNAIDLGIIDLDTMRGQIEREMKMKYLSMHNTSIWQGANDGKWYTRLKCENGGKKLVKRNSKEEIEEVIVQHYKLLDKAPTFERVFKEWLNYKITNKEIGNGTYDRYSTEFERFFKGTMLYAMDVDEITEDILEDFIKGRIAQLNLTAKAYSNMRTLINGTFKYAKKLKLTDLSISSFFGDLELSKRSFEKKNRQDEKQVFNEEEVEKITEYLKENESVENLGLLLAFQTGIREGELSGLKFSDLDNGKLHVQRQEIKYKDRENGGLIHEIVEYTKTDAGNRYIYLTQSALNTIERIRKLNPYEDYMMMYLGRKFYTNTFNDRLYKACEKVNIEKRSMHKIRKTYGTMLLDSGADDSLVMSQMGHSDIETTRKYYYFSNKNDSKKRMQIENAIKI